MRTYDSSSSKIATTRPEVLGAHFNVNTYAEQSIAKTTLLEGSVRVVHEPENAAVKPRSIGLNLVVLKSNQEAVLGKNNLFTVREVDVSDAYLY